MNTKVIYNTGYSLSSDAKNIINNYFGVSPPAEIFYESLYNLEFYAQAPISAGTLSKFTSSIENNGFLTPVFISPENGAVCDGIKRCRAAAIIRHDKIPCALFDSHSHVLTEDILIIKLIKTKCFHYFDEAILIHVLINSYLYTQEALASLLNVSQSYVANKLRLLKLSDDERRDIRAFNLTERTARTLLKIPDISVRHEAAEVIHSNSFSVSAAEKYIDFLCSQKSSYFDSFSAQKTARSIERLVDASAKGGENIVINKQESDSFIKLNIIISKGFT